MKNVISVDTILLNLAQDWYGVGKTYAADINPAHKSLEKAKQAMHSLLISKLPDTPENKAVLDEMFGVQNA